MSILINNLTAPIKTLKQALVIVKGFTKTEKMPSLSYSLPAKDCNKGSQLREIKGSVCSICYALKGNYVRYPNIVQVQVKRLKSIDDSRWVDAMSFIINRKKVIKDSGVFRWHDSGDIQSLNHFEKILQVVRNTPTIQHWLPTKESALVKNYKGLLPENLIIRLSGSMIDGKAPIYTNTSTAVSTKDSATCKAFEHEGKCNDCRKCWDKSIKTISYLVH